MRRVIAVALVVLALVGGWLLVRGDVPCDVLAAQPVCQVAVLPGPTQNTLPLITVEGADTYQPAGELRLTTIAVQEDLDFRSWFRAWASEVVDAVPREVIFPPGADSEQVTEANALLMADSQLMATVAALGASGYRVTGDGALVAGIADDAVTAALEVGDVIVEVDGDPVSDSRDVVEAVQDSEPGTTVTFTVDLDAGSRDDARTREVDAGTRDVDVQLGSSPDEPETPYVGLILTTELDLPVGVSIDAGEIGGPSAGLLFALSIVELLAPEDLTDGRIIAGTGTVDRDGVVGAVGGIRQKLVGATAPAEDEDPASVFLVPQGNFAEARRVAVERDVLLVPVETLQGAVDALENLRRGQDPDDAVLLAGGA